MVAVLLKREGFNDGLLYTTGYMALLFVIYFLIIILFRIGFYDF